MSARSAAVARLAADGDARRRLGAAARAQAIARHTWREHTRRIVDRLESVAGGRRPIIAAPSAR
jgi:glycosyltransferase involved in cell wall biosynthesis